MPPAIAALVVTALLLPAGAVAVDAVDAVDAVARVNGIGIARDEFERSWRAFLAKSGIPASHEESGGEVDTLRRQLLDGLIDEELVAQEARRLGITAAADAVAAEVAAAREKFPGEEEFHAALARSGLDEERLAALYGRRIAIEEYVEREVAGAVQVGDEEVAAFYRENPAAFEQPEQMRARHILVAVEDGADDARKAEARARAESLLARVRGGEDFAAVARESSDCPSSAEGGDLGFFARGQMVEPFDAAAFALAPGETSGIVESPYGFHIIRAEERRPAGMVSEAEAAPQIREFLRNRKAEQRLADRVAELRAAAKIELLLGE